MSVGTRTRRAAENPRSLRRAPGRACVLALLLGLCAAPALLATPAALAANPCPSLEHLRGFHGNASIVGLSTTAGGEDSGEGGLETIELAHHVANVRFDLHREPLTKHRLHYFAGNATHGDVEIEDAFQNTGTGFSGRLSYSNPLTSHLPNKGEAGLVFDRRKKHCIYAFELSFQVKTTFTGEEEVKPDLSVTGSAAGRGKKIPKKLKLVGSSAVSIWDSCPAGDPQGCYEIGGGWTSEFFTLFQCHSIVAVTCGNKSPGTAELNWSISPIFKKKPAKKK
jgi:hypothetical protein